MAVRRVPENGPVSVVPGGIHCSRTFGVVGGRARSLPECSWCCLSRAPLSSSLLFCALPQAVNVQFMQSNSIRVLQFGIQGNKEPFVDIPEDVREWVLRACGGLISLAVEAALGARSTQRHFLLALVFVVELTLARIEVVTDRLPVKCRLCAGGLCSPRLHIFLVAHTGHSRCITSVARRAEPSNLDPLQQGSLPGLLLCRWTSGSASRCLSGVFSCPPFVVCALKGGRPWSFVVPHADAFVIASIYGLRFLYCGLTWLRLLVSTGQASDWLLGRHAAESTALVADLHHR